MRITKKILREAKKGMLFRIKELTLMSDDEIEKEYIRCYPNLTLAPEDYPTVSMMRKELLMDVVERGIPSHWCD